MDLHIRIIDAMNSNPTKRKVYEVNGTMLFGLKISIQYPSGSCMKASPFILPVWGGTWHWYQEYINSQL